MVVVERVAGAGVVMVVAVPVVVVVVPGIDAVVLAA